MKKLITHSLLMIFVLISCQGETAENENFDSPQVEPITQITSQLKQEDVIDKPFENIDVPFQSFNYNNKKGSTIELPSGTLIKIPKKAFQDENGNPVSENIEIKYREFHDIGDIMLSGIKMTYQDGDFESAGMFEIRAEESGKNLELKADKEIDIEMASYREGDFDSFVMDEKAKQWNFIEKSKAKPNERKQKRIEKNKAAEASLLPVCSEQPRALKDTDEIFDLDFSFYRHKELSFLNGAMWIIKGDDDTKKKFKYDRKQYNDISITPLDSSCNDYTIQLWNRSEVDADKDPVKTTYTAEPVWTGNELRKAKKDYKKRLREFKKQLKEIEKERRSLEREADLVRSFKLKGMGIYNCDRTLDYIKMVAVGIIISCKEKIKNWWYITMNKKVAIKYYQPNDGTFKYNPNGENSVIAVLPNDKLGVVTPEEFERAYEAYRKSDDPNKILEVEMTVEGESMAERQQFKKHIARY